MLTKTQRKDQLARKGESFAAQYYCARGATVIAANVSYAVGEIDLIVREPDGTIVFVEVKTRSGAGYGISEAVTPRKYARMRKAASQWLRGPSSPRVTGNRLADVRFDVLALRANGAGFDAEYFQGVENGAG
ncbi:endonuclease [Corynebacterium phocae]|uniref:UPF0102 protein CPHO_04755 n=1 Tax=Corynebacterium phocae TaxID=161895 RepID=A0A1L7D2V4_9CORY|nr:YraN family protein [Corynebacterium phocae]APT92312.1 endonuclease [Corynebacterium phocae]KAA8725347.1 YraN family protein [Corynebacterium phocae]